MDTKRMQGGACHRALSLGIATCAVLLAAGELEAATLWSNGTVSTGISGDNKCDSGPNLCGNTGGAAWTVFDNFNIPSGKTWNVTGFDFTDFLTNGPTSDYKSTNWSLWNGDPLIGGKLVASGSTTAGLTLLSGTCGTGSTCLETFTIGTAPLLLGGGNTYFLGTTNVITPINSNETTLRAFAAGGNTAPGGVPNPLQRWEQSNGSTTGVVGSSWTAGSVNNTFPGAIPETATAFDIIGTTVTVPEPASGAMTLLAIALTWFGFIRRNRRRGLLVR